MNGNGRVGVGLRQRKRFETSNALSQAATRLCIQRGWENVTVDEIATATNVSPRTFRNYFSTKAEAVAAGHLERMLDIANEVRTRPLEEPLWTAITHAVTAQFEAPGQEAEDIADASLWKERIRFLLTEPAIQGEVLKAAVAAQRELAKAIAERIGASHVNELYPQLAAAVVTAVVDVVGRRWLRDGPSGSIVPLVRNAFDLVGDGFRERETKTGR